MYDNCNNSPNDGDPATGSEGETSLLEAALSYAALGIPVFPCGPDKKPLIPRGFKGATTDETKIRRWWEKKFPGAMIAIPTGEVSGLAVLDLDYEIDPATGEDLKDGRLELEVILDREGVAFPETYAARTPRCGNHLYFKHEEGFKSSAGKIGPHIDTRAEGGYIIAPPSQRLDGGAYRAELPFSLEAIAAAPPWLAAGFRTGALFKKEPEQKDSQLEAANLDELRAALEVIPNDDPSWDKWNRMGMAIHGATAGSNEGFELFDEWSRKWSDYNAEYTVERWKAYQHSPPDRIGAGTVFHLADEADPGWRKRVAGRGISPEDFFAYMPTHLYLYIPTREFWPKESVNARLGKLPLLGRGGRPVLNEKMKPVLIQANAWLDKYRPVEQMTWAPGEPLLIRDRVMSDGGWIEKDQVSCLNLYRPPMIAGGDAEKAGPWLEHVRRVYPDDADHIIKWCAHRVQKPQEKLNHALVLGGKQGIGKDSLLEPVKRAVGPWNFVEVSPAQMLGRFNDFAKGVILRVNEGRDLGDVSRFEFYDHTKAYIAAPPDVLRVDEKNLREHAVLNCTGVIITTNHRTNGIYLPPDDRRHYVAWPECDKDDFSEEYWVNLWGWYESEGYNHIAAYLSNLELSGFNPKAPPPKTTTFWAIVHANQSPEDAELADVLDAMGRPDATTLDELLQEAKLVLPTAYGFHDWLQDRKSRRAIPHRLEQCGYVQTRNATRDGLWMVKGKRKVIYARAELTPVAQIQAARKLSGG